MQHSILFWWCWWKLALDFKCSFIEGSDIVCTSVFQTSELFQFPHWKTLVSCDVMLCCWVSSCWCFKWFGSCLGSLWCMTCRWKHYSALKHQDLLNKWYSVTSWKTVTFSDTCVNRSNLMWIERHSLVTGLEDGQLMCLASLWILRSPFCWDVVPHQWESVWHVTTQKF
jgi:hypothetical protein